MRSLATVLKLMIAAAAAADQLALFPGTMSQTAHARQQEPVRQRFQQPGNSGIPRIDISGLEYYSVNQHMCELNLSYLLHVYPGGAPEEYHALTFSHNVAKRVPCAGEGKWVYSSPAWPRVNTRSVNCQHGTVDRKEIGGAEYSGADWGSRELWAEVCRNWR